MTRVHQYVCQSVSHVSWDGLYSPQTLCGTTSFSVCRLQRRHFTLVSSPIAQWAHTDTHSTTSALVLIGTRRRVLAVVYSHVHVWAKLACLTQLCSISGIYCHTNTIPLAHKCTHSLVQSVGTHTVCALTYAQWLQLAVGPLVYLHCKGNPNRPVAQTYLCLTDCFHCEKESRQNSIRREGWYLHLDHQTRRQGRRGLNANKSPVILILISEQFINSSPAYTHIYLSVYLSVCVFLLAALLSTDYPVGKIYVFPKYKVNTCKHTNTMYLYWLNRMCGNQWSSRCAHIQSFNAFHIHSTACWLRHSQVNIFLRDWEGMKAKSDTLWKGEGRSDVVSRGAAAAAAVSVRYPRWFRYDWHLSASGVDLAKVFQQAPTLPQKAWLEW